MTTDPIGLGGGINTYTYFFGNPDRFIDPLGLRVVATEINLFGFGVGIFFDTGSAGTGSFEGINDIGVFLDLPDKGFRDTDISDIARRVRGSFRFTSAFDRCAFDRDAERFNANLILVDFTADVDLQRATVGVGVNIPFPFTEVEARTTKSGSLRDLGRHIRAGVQRLHQATQPLF